MSSQMLPVPFDGDTLFLADRDGEPYVPARPICDALALGWSAQHEKLNSDKGRWGVRVIRTPSPGGAQQTLCLPLRKVPAWLMTIHAGRVKPEIRDKLRRYQAECDDALWAYWNHGVAVNPRTRSEAHDELSRARWAPAPALRRKGRLSIVERDAEVRLFVEQLLAQPFTYVEIAAMARARFGGSRAASKSTIHRHDQWLRAAAADA